MHEYKLIILFLVTSIEFAQPCGITTHIEIAHRAFSHFDYLFEKNISISKIIEKYQSAFQAGAPFPDSFYSDECKKGVYHQVSEDTHWVPFLNSSINYVRKKYSKPYNEDALRLIVFILGFSSHQMADVTWHSLGIEQGFLAAMGDVNFHGSFDAAHGVGDFGGDVLNQFELDLKYISSLNEWYVPFDDLYNIYFDLYGKELITREVIIECSTLMYLARLGEKLAVSLLYTTYYSKSTFLEDKLNDYFLGGLDDMAAWTQISWNKVLYMLENGTDKCDLKHSIIDLNCVDKLEKAHNKVNKIHSSNSRHFLEENFNRNRLDDSYLNVEFHNDRSVLLKSSEKFNEKYLKQSLSFYDSIKQHQISHQIPNTTYSINNEYANLGWSLASDDLNNDNIDDLIISAPVFSTKNFYQNGAVFLVLSKNKSVGHIGNLDVENTADKIIFPPKNIINSRFGHSVVVLDLNQDGFNDLIVGAPSYNLRNISYEGRVFVYFGDSSANFEQLSIEITCTTYKYCNLGWSLSAGDVNADGSKDLIVSSPYASQYGFTGVLFSKKNMPSILDASELDWVLNGKMAYEWFGHSAVSKVGFLAVGAPQSRICELKTCDFDDRDKQSVGRVYLYKYPSAIPLITLTGTSEFEQFGYSFDLSIQSKQTVIAVSSISKDSKLNEANAINLKYGGIVQVFSLNSILHGLPNVMCTLKSDRSYSAFGSRVRFYDLNNDSFDDLLIGAHLRSHSLLPISEMQQGILYAFKGGNDFPKGNYTDECNDVIPCPGKKSFLTLENLENKARFGFEFTLLKSNSNQNKLAVSAIHSNTNSKWLSGKVNIFDLK